jgi:hypothetical protein
MFVNSFWLMLVIFAVPGNWLMIASACLVAYYFRDAHVFSIATLIFITAMALIGELLEFFSGMGGARKAGAGWFASIGAIFGAVMGAVVGTFVIPIPVVGTIAGACIGAAILTAMVELAAGKDQRRSINSGLGAGIGVLFGTTAKFLIGCVIWFTITVAAFWP